MSEKFNFISLAILSSRMKPAGLLVTALVCLSTLCYHRKCL